MRQKPDGPISVDTRTIVRLSPGLSSIADRRRGQAVVLDEWRGRYWRLSGKMLDLVWLLRQFPEGRALSDLCSDLRANPNEEEFLNAIRALKANRLIHIQTTRMGTKPAVRLVLRYAFLNLRYQCQLFLRGWIPVWAIRCSQLAGLTAVFPNALHNVAAAEVPEVVEEVIAAIRMACAIPWVRPLCTPSALATYHLLRDMGYCPMLMLGGTVASFEPHMWVELDGWRIVAGSDEQSLDAFQPLAILSSDVPDEERTARSLQS